MKDEFDQLKEAYKDFANIMRQTKLGTAIVWLLEFTDKCLNRLGV